MKNPISPKLIKEAQFRKEMGGISRATLWRLTKKGEIPLPIKIGGSTFYEEGSAAELIAQKREEADARQKRLTQAKI